VAILDGTTGNDVLRGTDDDDIFNGLAGNDFIFGGAGNDRIFLGDGEDMAQGGNGNDILEGGGGRDRLIGGNGADNFGFFIGGSDTDAILDFEQGVDTITFFTTDEGLTEADVLASVVDFGTHFVFEFGFGLDGEAFLEQRLSVIKNDPDFTLTVDDFTIEVFIDNVPGDLPLVSKAPLDGEFAAQDLAANEVAFYDYGALI